MRFSLIAVLWLAPSVAFAQAATQDTLFGPTNPRLKGPPAAYRSVFEKPQSEPEETPWRAANDEAGQLGGHSGQLRESAEPATAPAHHDMHGAASAAPSSRTHSHDHK